MSGTTINVNTFQSLQSAIATVDAAASGTYTINVTASITETANLAALNLASGVSVTIDGSNGSGGVNTLSGGSTYRGLFVAAGSVTVENLSVNAAAARGGNGAGGSGGAGGGGAGLGGGLFVASGGTVTLSGVSFGGDSATGGNGGMYPLSQSGIKDGGGGGGGMGGNGAVGGTSTPYSGGAGGTSGVGNLPGGLGVGGAGAQGGLGAANTGHTGNFGGGGGGGGGSFGVGGNGGFGGGGGMANAGQGAGGFGAASGGYTGAHFYAGGGLGAGGDIFIQAGGLLTIEGGTLGAGTVTGGLTGSEQGKGYGNGIFLQGTQSVNLAAAAGTITTFAGVITDQNGAASTSAAGGAATVVIGDLSAVNTGIVAFTTSDTYVGGTTIDSGTLQLGAGGTAGSILGNVTLAAAGTLAFDRSNPVIFTGVVSGAGALVQEGSGTLTLLASDTFSGGTTIASGVLCLGTGGTTGSIVGNVNVASPATLEFDRSGNLTFAGTIGGAGALVKQGSGTLSLLAANTFVGNTTIAAGAVQLGNGGTVGSIAGNVSLASGTALDFDCSNAVSDAGTIFGGGRIAQLGSGTLTLLGADTFTGGTTITAGALQLGAGGTAGAIAGNVAVASAAALEFDHSDSLAFTGSIAGAGAVVQRGVGTLSLSAANSFAGGTTLLAGALALAAPTAAGSGHIVFGTAAGLVLEIGSGDTPANTIDGLALTDTIDLQGIGTATGASLVSGNTLLVSGGSGTVALSLSASQNFAPYYFALTGDQAGGTDASLELLQAETIAGAVAGQATLDRGTIAAFAGVTISDPNGIGQTDTVTVTSSNTLDGTLSDAVGGSVSASGVYTVSGSASVVSAALQGLSFAPSSHQVAPASTVATGFTIAVIDSSGQTAGNTTTSVVATAANDAPTITGASAAQATTDAAIGFTPLAGVTIADVDFGVTETVTLTLTAGGVATDADGTLSGAVSKIAIGNYTVSGTPAAVSTDLDALIFTPTAHQVAPGGTVATAITITATQNGTTTTNSTASIIATALNDPPVIAGTQSGQSVTDATTDNPFSAVTISDPDVGASETVSITLTAGGVASDADGVLSGSGLTRTGVGTYALAAGTPAAATAPLQALVFTPTAHQVAPGGTVATGMTLSVTDGIIAAPVTDVTTSVIATALNDPPVIAGTQAGQSVTDAATDNPFSAVSISDPDFGASETVGLTLTAGGVASDADGVLSGSGLIHTGIGTYALAAGTPAAATAALQALVFTPTPHQVAPGGTVTTGMTLSVTDGIIAAPITDATTSVIATALNDPPVIAGTQAGQSVTDATTDHPFSAVTISDPDFGASETVSITLTAGGVASDADGSLSGSGLTHTGIGTYALAAGTPAAATAALQALVFTPTPHQVTPGATVTTGMTLLVADGAAPVTDATTSVIATAVNDPPVIAGTQAGQSLTDATTEHPFSAVTISDPDFGASETFSITLTAAGVASDADGSLSGSGLTHTGIGTYALAAGTPAAATAALQTLLFTPTSHQVAPGSIVATGMTLSVTDGIIAAPVTDANTSVIATAVNDPPVIAGTQSGQSVTDATTDHPFSAVTISDPDFAASEIVSITLTASGVASGADGILSGSGLTHTGIGLYTLAAGTPAAVSSELQALVFTPTAHQVASGGTVATGIAIAATQNGTTTTNSTTSIIATALNDPPVISGTQSGQSVTDATTDNPFSAVTISDPDFGASETVSITLTAGGVASDADGVLSGSGVTRTGVGTYALAAGRPAAATAALQALVFTPTAHQVASGGTVVTGMVLSVSDGVAPMPTSDATTSVVATAAAPPSAPTGLGLAAASDSGTVGDGITTVALPAITGNAPAGDTVTLYDGSTVIGSGIADATGAFSVTPTIALAEGANDLVATATEGSGRVSADSASFTVTLDTVAPAATTLNQTNASGLTGAAEPGSAITFLNAGTAVATAQTGSGGSWSFLPSILAAGTYAISATVTDDAGNNSPASPALAVVVAADHSFIISTTAAGITDSRAYGANDVLVSDTTAPAGGGNTNSQAAFAVTQVFNSSGTLTGTDTTSSTGLLLQSVTQTQTVRNIYNSAGVLIGTITEAGSATGVAPPGFTTAAQTAGATTTDDGTGSFVNLLSEDNSFDASGDDTIAGGAGNDTISAGGHALSVAGGSGLLLFVGGSGASTVTGGAGSATIIGGSAGGIYQGGQSAGNELFAGGGNTTLLGGSGHDILAGGPGASTIVGSTGGADTLVGGSGSNILLPSANDLVFAESGASTVYGSATGSNVFIGGGEDVMLAGGGSDEMFAGDGGSTTMFGGSGSDVFVGGSGNTTMVAGANAGVFVGGAGAETVFGSTGNDTVWTGGGHMSLTEGGGADDIVLQSGSAALFGGSGKDIYFAAQGFAGGSDVISGFKVGTDQIKLLGYGGAYSQQSSGGSTTLGLADGTVITLVGVTHLASSSVLTG